MNLFGTIPDYPTIEGIDLRCCGVDEILKVARGARLIVADPPWRYAREAGGANPEENGIYAALSEMEIVRHLDLSFDCAAPNARLAVWYTWPKDAEWNIAGGAGPRWGSRTTGGTWTKTGYVGVGYHWRGQSEPVAIFTRGSTGRPKQLLLNAHVSPIGPHSEKPWQWMRQWVLAWTDPGDLIVDLYAGLAPLARACVGTGRRYIGAEIDHDRHQKAMGLLTRFNASFGKP